MVGLKTVAAMLVHRRTRKNEQEVCSRAPPALAPHSGSSSSKSKFSSNSGSGLAAGAGFFAAGLAVAGFAAACGCAVFFGGIRTRNAGPSLPRKAALVG